MVKQSNDYAMPMLEQEFELEMNDLDGAARFETIEEELESILETDEPEGEAEYEYGDEENEYDENEYENEYDHEAGDEEGEYESPEEEWEMGGNELQSYGERLYELSQREYEAGVVNQELESMLDDVEREYFWGAIVSGVKALSGIPAVRRAVGGLLNKGVSFAKGLISRGGKAALAQVSKGNLLKGATELLRGNLKGAAMPLLQSAVRSLTPGAQEILPGVMAQLGINPQASPAANTDALNKLMAKIQNAYKHAAENISDKVDEPVEAGRLAAKSFEVSLMPSQGYVRRGVYYPPQKPTPPPAPTPATRVQVRDQRTTPYSQPAMQNGVRVIRLRRRPGEQAVHKIVVYIE
jgi:hypothetical protein